MAFNEELAHTKLNEIIDELDSDLAAHPRFLEHFIIGCSRSLNTTQPNNYLVRVHDDGKAVTISGKGKHGYMTPVQENPLSPEYVYKTTIGFTTVNGDTNWLKVSFESGELESKDQVIASNGALPNNANYNTTAFLSVRNETRFYNSAGIEMSAGELSDTRFPLTGHIDPQQLEQQTFDMHHIDCCINMMPVKANERFCRYSNARRRCYYRWPDNLGLVSIVEEDGLGVKRPVDIKTNRYYAISDASQKPMDICFEPNEACTLEADKYIKSSNDKIAGMSYEEFGQLAKKHFRDSLVSGIDFRNKHNGRLSDNFEDMCTYLLETTESYGTGTGKYKR